VATSILDAEWQDPTNSSFGERDRDVIALINEEDLALFTFDGLKRRLGLHPETLSRILGRLEHEGIVQKGPGGYKVTSKISEFPRLRPTCGDESHVPLLQTFLPSDMSVQQLILDLRGRWFGLLRWMGLSENGEGVTLKWVTDGGDVQVDANISERALTIEAKFLHDRDLNMALKASYQLMTHIGKLCSSSRLIRRVAYFGGFDVRLMSA
jgi:DNA-binding transcriptional regulator YhcF (GntR family)